MLELLNVNPSSGEPIYRQLHDQIVRLIVGGQLHPEDVLPSVRQLAEHLAVNPMTVSRAMQQLVDQGWVERRRGQPSRVAARTSANSASGSSLLAPQLSELVEQARQLGVDYDQLQRLLAQYWDKE
ncbi:GntR family transcriptional regulator [Shewanella sp. SR43-4]|jgi:GntR family transcriptional regulator|uniref:GntR family transcriptional regulator n=1 Tax=Shewanella TaxID=22 RepID=UPI000C684E74|nr:MULTISPECIES: GntR family transcriptional regulator [Shewanella]NCQ45739.1 GntR family transcriptional regulator [Shewanella frigidimarina]MBB1318498.1 GntR family transcriptional regulator [Shewanella sp. SR43-4]MBB1322476.1 GntR family transcriptional regulator [Shewanella sp. SR43-8]MBB1476966.1 GntR family transcriptional regulator [Shewanella sp. SG41-3]NCO72410.1 GntR family transcriptional regulator [Shewanella vesiculosa]|tara:strand:+ start:93 stop:470 length:378 start_codon:yes stop_codon:yes gene_type:complete